MHGGNTDIEAGLVTAQRAWNQIPHIALNTSIQLRFLLHHKTILTSTYSESETRLIEYTAKPKGTTVNIKIIVIPSASITAASSVCSLCLSSVAKQVLLVESVSAFTQKHGVSSEHLSSCSQQCSELQGHPPPCLETSTRMPITSRTIPTNE